MDANKTNKYHHCNDCPYQNKIWKKYPSMWSEITICKKYNKQLYYYGNEENQTPRPCKECEKRFSYVPHI